MRLGISLLCAAVLSIGSTTALFAADAPLPAFPGAEGWGASTVGGRGGKIIEVTNLSDTGAGSLRDAVEAQGPRIVVFRVSGTIPLSRDLVVRNPNITIAGQTAPGDGICLKNYKMLITGNEVIVRHLRVRRGNESGRADDSLGIEGADHVIVDHCSLGWSMDETLNTWHGAKNISVQWCIVSEALHNRNHGFAATLGGTNASFHHDLIANCPGRNPSIGGNHEFQTRNMDYRNNVQFNWGSRTFDGKPSSINIVNNYFKPGPMSKLFVFARIDASGAYPQVGIGRWYLSGNYFEGNEAISKDNKSGTTGAKELLVDEPCEFAPVKMVSAQEVFPIVLADVGATMPKRDSVDARVVEEVRTGKTTFGDGVVMDPKDVGGWPDLKSSPAPADSDHDGMPDWWETRYGLNPNDASDGSKDLNGDGYTNVEKYLNALDPTKKIDWRNPENNKNTLKPGSLDEPKH